jgi:hypothetical protein
MSHARAFNTAPSGPRGFVGPAGGFQALRRYAVFWIVLVFFCSILPLHAESLTFNQPFTLTGDTPFTGDLGELLDLQGGLIGYGNVLKTGDAIMRPGTPPEGTFEGDITVNRGVLLVSGSGQLGDAGNTVSVHGASVFGLDGGMLVVDGGFQGLTISQTLTLAGRGPAASGNYLGRSLLSIGNNLFTGGLLLQASSVSSEFDAVYGNTTLAGAVSFGTGRQAIFSGNGNVIITGSMSSFESSIDRIVKTTGSLQQSTLWLQNNANNFLSSVGAEYGATLRVADGRAVGSNPQSAVRLEKGLMELRADPDTIGTFSKTGVYLVSCWRWEAGSSSCRTRCRRWATTRTGCTTWWWTTGRRLR